MKTLKDYSTEELKAEIKRRQLEEEEDKRLGVKRCRHCRHWGEVGAWGGKPGTKESKEGANRRCPYFKTKTGNFYAAKNSSDLACEHFE